MMKIKFLFLALVLNFSCHAFCLNQCYVLSLKNDGPRILLDPDSFKVVAKTKESTRQVCQAKFESFGSFLSIEVNDILSSETMVSIRKGQKLISAISYSDSQGTLSDYTYDIKISCSK